MKNLKNRLQDVSTMIGQKVCKSTKYFALSLGKSLKEGVNRKQKPIMRFHFVFIFFLCGLSVIKEQFTYIKKIK